MSITKDGVTLNTARGAIDAADRLILNALREHGRASVTELATTTGLSA